ncbi:MAG TPA: toll/interleukin-1 receptor domain-containing protein, partial [Saprospiraceae bacterium]|nr:toll/interleukin-1 receptor domain-containing protein [Saprospiraceae bacterium]
MSTPKIFFSYSRMDSAFALRLAKDIRSAGADIWIDQLDIPVGNHWDAAVEKALITSSCVLVILSPSSTASNNVKDEISFAVDTGKKIIPVLLEECLAPFRLRRLQHIDFTKDYDEGLKQLLASLENNAAHASRATKNTMLVS